MSDMALSDPAPSPETRARRERRSRWLLLTPALVILSLAASGPLLVVVIYSFLTPGDYGGVEWQFSLDPWFNVVAERDFFTEELKLADAHLLVFWRSIKLSLMTAIHLRSASG